MLALLACTCGDPADPVTLEPAGPPPDPYPALQLGKDAERIDAHLAAMAAASSSDEALCEAVRSSRATAGALSEHLFGLDRGDTGWSADVYDQTQELSDTLVGVDIGFGSEGLYGGPDWTELSAAAGDTPGGRFLGASAGWLGEFGHSEWIDWVWDQGGCSNPIRAAERLAALDEAWDDAPECLRSALHEELLVEVHMFGNHACYCTDAATARTQLDVVLPLLEGLPQLGGPDEARQLLADLPDARFEDPECAGH